jgi:hypothetical protein
MFFTHVLFYNFSRAHMKLLSTAYVLVRLILEKRQMSRRNKGKLNQANKKSMKKRRIFDKIN